MKTAVFGSRGMLGSHLIWKKELGEISPFNRESFPLDGGDLSTILPHDLAFLCAGTKGTEACEGNREAFRSDVDGNIRLSRHLLKQGTFVVFVSTDAVEWALHTAYARNRFMVELAIGNEPNVAIFRPGKFTESNVSEVAKACAEVGLQRKEGLTRWPT